MSMSKMTAAQSRNYVLQASQTLVFLWRSVPEEMYGLSMVKTIPSCVQKLINLENVVQMCLESFFFLGLHHACEIRI